MKKMLFVMNPCAGTRKANKVLPEILNVFNRAGWDVCTYITENQRDAHTVISRRAGEFDAVVCCGGDGTFNETVAGVLSSGAQVPVGYIPAGSTNDFAISLGLPTDFIEAAKGIVEGTPQEFDMGQFGSRYFSYVASFGAFTRASYATPQNVKNALGHTAYILGGIQEISQIRNIHARLELDDEVLEDNYLFGAVCNTTSVAGILTLDSSKVDMADGLFEILLVRSPRNITEITECIQAIQNKTYDGGTLTFRSAKSVRISMNEPVDWTLDGEWQPGCDQVEITNLRHAIKLLRKD